jgi:hypothetical protein
MKKLLVFALIVLGCILTSDAQFSGGRQGGAGMSMGRFYGKILDSKSNKGIDAASVQLIQSKFDTVSRKRKDTIISGMLTKANGDFSYGHGIHVC